ncbi:DUF4123 domain-containing protein [Sphingomonas sp.]|jgi:hypothetical protein|uniref:DUF4123 domain-containing protein n=1 Tax=Sphingomonas sp. TaxID=28214 RepID=UPI002D7F2AFC|nr:DUF4123 domain-containing protein [Sphingomonas sp.]HEU0044499.1 DUF4123 domain-containing protein [Sphingomonas sp.]
MSGTDVRWYAVVDTAQDERLLGLVQGCREHQCLVGGTLEPELAATLPWLVAFDPAEPLARAWRGEGTGKGWGILLTSDLPFASLRTHLKKFQNARLPDGRLVWFRFFDPAVLQALFRSSSPEEQAPWFKGVERYVIEADDQPGHYHVRFADGQLSAEMIAPVAA